MKKGDVVRLNSGGPKMTVINNPSVGEPVQCTWFTKRQTARSGVFSWGTVEPAGEDTNA